MWCGACAGCVNTFFLGRDIKSDRQGQCTLQLGRDVWRGACAGCGMGVCGESGTQHNKVRQQPVSDDVVGCD